MNSETVKINGLNIDHLSAEERSIALRRAIRLGNEATCQLTSIEKLYDEMLDLAQPCYEDARYAHAEHQAKLAEFDAESERLLAETAARVRSLRARLSHLKNDAPSPGLPHTPEDIQKVEDEIAVARGADEAAISERLALRRPIADRAHAARRELLEAGSRFWGLALELRPVLSNIAAAGRVAEQLQMLPQTASGEFRRMDEDMRQALRRLDRDADTDGSTGPPSAIHLARCRVVSGLKRTTAGGADVHADSVVLRYSAPSHAGSGVRS